MSDYGQDTNWTKSPEDQRWRPIPAQAKMEGFPSLRRQTSNLSPAYGIAAPDGVGGQYCKVLASKTQQDINALNSRRNGVVVEAAASGTNKNKETLYTSG